MLQSIDYSLRKAGIDDIEQIYMIEQESFKNPWSMSGFYNEFDVSLSDIIVAEYGKDIIGFAIAWFVGEEIQLHKIAVSGDFRKRGIAMSFINYYIRKYGRAGAKVMFLEVREKNVGARAFYRKLGFQETGIRKNYYPDDHAVLIRKDLW
ncbi:MAG: ribosomal protein S18-alanine N-acetyltransferase [Spirochaetes bacterium]|nr:ribosomal protein S18-alanine N-acetyltransferase [Spirochaetota bacterium]